MSEVTTPRATKRSRTDRSGRSAKSREAILRVAAKMIAREGIQGLRVEQVAEDAGVSTALLYYHFGNRLGLVNAAFEFASEQAPSTALRLASDNRTGYEALEEALLAELDDSARVRDYSIVWGDVSANAVFQPALRPGLRSITRAWRMTVAGAIERGIADGSIKEGIDPQEAAELLIVVVDGCSLRWLAGSLELDQARHLLRNAVRQIRR